MYEKFESGEVLEALDRLIQRSETVLEGEEEELRQARSGWLTLTVKEHVVGSLAQEEEERREAALSRFSDLRSRVHSERATLNKLRAAREEWETGLPRSLRNKFEDLLSPNTSVPSRSRSPGSSIRSLKEAVDCDESIEMLNTHE